MKNKIILVLSLFLIIVTPLWLGGKGEAVQVFLEVTGVLLVSMVLLNVDSMFLSNYRGVLFFCILSIFACLMYLLPVGEQLWMLLPGRSFYADVVSFLNSKEVHLNFSISLVRDATLKSILSLLAPLSIFLAVLQMKRDYLYILIFSMVGVASLEAVLGIIQYVSESQVLYFGVPNSGGAQGTYLNRNHFSALMEMALPFTLIWAFIIYDRGGIGSQLLRPSSVRLGWSMVVLMLSCIIITASGLSQSRAGFSLVVLGSFACLFFLRAYIKKPGRVTLYFVSFVVLFWILFDIDFIGGMSRFFLDDVMGDGRWGIFSIAFSGVKDFFPLGSGPGTFADVYRALQDINQRGFINHAHNDYLELVFEMGGLGIMIILGYWVIFISGCLRLMKENSDVLFFMKGASGIGVALILLHSLVDFNLHVPANMVYFSLLSGIFLNKMA